MSRIKIILLILIIAALGIVFVQNREPIALKLLCADYSQSCLYQTPRLPLALWIGLVTFLGAIASLLIRVLNNYGYKNSRRPKATIDNDLYPDPRNRQTKNRQDGYAVSTIDSEDLSVKNKYSDTTNYEVKQEPQNIERSGSNYSYKYREAGDRLQDSPDSTNKAAINPKTNTNQTYEQDDEDWI